MRVAAFDGENADPTNGRLLGECIRARTPWGELTYGLAGAEGYNLIRASDEQGIAPGAETIRELFGQEPTLVLIDELSIYLRKLKAKERDRAGGQLTAFLTALFKAVSLRLGRPWSTPWRLVKGARPPMPTAKRISSLRLRWMS